MFSDSVYIMKKKKIGFKSFYQRSLGQQKRKVLIKIFAAKEQLLFYIKMRLLVPKEQGKKQKKKNVSISSKIGPSKVTRGLIMHLQVSLYTFSSVQVHHMVTGKKRRGLKG